VISTRVRYVLDQSERPRYTYTQSLIKRALFASFVHSCKQPAIIGVYSEYVHSILYIGNSMNAGALKKKKGKSSAIC
jgi:hypothetical protein